MNNISIKISKFFLYLVPLSVVIVYNNSLFPFIVGKYFFFRTVVSLALVFFAFGWATTQNNAENTRNKTEKNWRLSALWRQPLVIAVSIFALIFILSGFFGYDPASSFWSNFERGEGGLQMLYLLIFFILSVLLFKDEKSWRKMFYVIAGTSILVVIYGILGSINPTWNLNNQFLSNFIGSDFCGRFSDSSIKLLRKILIKQSTKFSQT